MKKAFKTSFFSLIISCFFVWIILNAIYIILPRHYSTQIDTYYLAFGVLVGLIIDGLKKIFNRLAIENPWLAFVYFGILGILFINFFEFILVNCYFHFWVTNGAGWCSFEASRESSLTSYSSNGIEMMVNGQRTSIGFKLLIIGHIKTFAIPAAMGFINFKIRRDIFKTLD
jgi:hypothetical protein